MATTCDRVRGHERVIIYDIIVQKSFSFRFAMYAIYQDTLYASVPSHLEKILETQRLYIPYVGIPCYKRTQLLNIP